MTRLLGLVLAGGRSTRMGEDKALLPLPGRPAMNMLGHARALLGAVTPAVLVSCRKGCLYAGYDCIEDVGPSVSPASGIYSGLLQAARLNFAGVLVLACDLPLMRASVMRLIAQLHGGDWASLYQNGATGRVEMLAGVYGTDFLPALAQGLAAGQKSIYQMLPACKRKLFVYGPRLAPVFMNCNTPEEFARLIPGGF